LSFEIKERDLLARIGSLETKRGLLETPALIPVVNPTTQVILPRKMWEEFKCKLIMANAYIIKRKFEKEAVSKGIHDFLDFPGMVMTDSGAYQILVYGEVEVTPEGIIKFQEEIGTDIATPLDVPTGWTDDRKYAEWTVKETLYRVKLTKDILTDKTILWVGPIQGGKYLDLIEKSAKETSLLEYQIYALGSPTQIMEQYLFSTLVDMVMTSKLNLPLDNPLHLFGAGHPVMFALAVSMGCDMFDSAAYAIYARQGRYLTEYGTFKFDQLEHLPCSCPMCSQTDVKELKSLTKKELEKSLAEHNLYVCQSEIRKIKQAIIEGRLWELLELRARSHPSLLQALSRLKFYREYIERHTPVTKKRGLLYFGSTGLSRPEITRYEKKIQENYTPPNKTRILLLLPQTQTKPFHKSHQFNLAWRKIKKLIGVKAQNVHVCIYTTPFGVVPIELDEVYPISQSEISQPDEETLNYAANQIQNYATTKKYNVIILHHDLTVFGNKLVESCRKACKKTKKKFIVTSNKAYPWGSASLTELAEAVKTALKG